MGLEMEDRTGKPRRDKEIAECISIINRRFAGNHPLMAADPELFVNLMCIKNCLEELLQRRGSGSQ